MLGQRINNYEIIEEIGSGGMGTVYLARHPFINRRAAIKVLRKEFVSSADVANRFLNEALAANAIGHPSIIDIIDAGRLPHDGTPYLMMEFLEGESLAKRIKRDQRIPIADAVTHARQIASALAAAHAKGIIHRDLKPENLFLVADPRNPGRELVKVLDFGIAKLLQGAGIGPGVHTQTGMVMGTPSYMSPEQCRGATDEIDHRTDVYALGIITYEMVCGAPPFEAPWIGDVLVMQMTQEVVHPHRRNPEVPEYLEREILRALSKRRQDRHGSMQELYAALQPPVITAREQNQRGDVKAAGFASENLAPGGAQIGATHAMRDKSTTLSSVAGQIGATVPATKTRWNAWTVAAAGLALLGSVLGLVLLENRVGRSPRARATTDGTFLPLSSPPAPRLSESPSNPSTTTSVSVVRALVPDSASPSLQWNPADSSPFYRSPASPTSPEHAPSHTATSAADERRSRKTTEARHPRTKPKTPATGQDDAPIKF